MAILPRYYVYVLARPNGKPFYVGKGQGYRVFEHDSEAKRGHKCYKCNVIRKIWKQGKEVLRYVVFTTDSEQDAYDYERDTIEMYGLDTLTNMRSGGGEAFIYTPEYLADLKARMAQPNVREWHLQQLQKARGVRKQNAMKKRTNGEFCIIPGCTKKSKNALCRGHQAQKTMAAKRGIPFEPKPLRELNTNTVDVCTVSGCGRKVNCRNLCRSHYGDYCKAAREGMEWTPKPIRILSTAKRFNV